MPASAVLELESKPAAHPLIYTESEAALISMNSDSPFGQSAAKSASELEQERLLKERNAQKLKEVEKQQADFGEKVNLSIRCGEEAEKEKQFKASSTPSPQGMEQNEKTKIQITHDI